jgi:hypothetical protein
MNLFFSFVNLCLLEFEFVCVISQKRRIDLEDDMDPENALSFNNTFQIVFSNVYPTSSVNNIIRILNPVNVYDYLNLYCRWNISLNSS